MKRIFWIFAAGVALFFQACEKESEIKPESDYYTPDFNVSVESVVTYDAVVEDVVEATEYEVDFFSGTTDALDGQFSVVVSENLKSGTFDWRTRYLNSQCPLITIVSEEGGFPKTITLDYGEKTELINGRILSGIIEIVVSAPFYEQGATRTVSFIGFSVDTVGIGGTKTKTLVSIDDEREVSINRQLTFTLPDGTVIEHTAVINRLWSEGLGTPFYHGDDVFEINGYANFTDSDGTVYQKQITDKLIKKGDCRYIVSGTVELSVANMLFASIDYGNGACDNVATMTTAEGTRDFIIGKRARR